MFKKFLATLLALFAAAAFAAVDVNKADQAQLDSIKGIGPAIAGKILDERKKGAFKDWTDLVDRVKGVGEGNAAKLSEAGLTVNGATFKGMAAKPAAAAPAPAPAPTPAPAATAAPKATAPAAPAPAPATAAKVEDKKAVTAEDKKAMAKKDKEDKAAAKKQAKEDKAAAKKAQADKTKTDKATAADGKASAPAAKK